MEDPLDQRKRQGFKSLLYQISLLSTKFVKLPTRQFHKVSQALSNFFKSILPLITHLGFPGGASGKESTCQYRKHKRCRFGPWVGKTPWRRKCQPIPVFLTEKSHGQNNLVGYIPWGHKERTQLRTHTHITTCESSSHSPNCQIYVSTSQIHHFPPFIMCLVQTSSLAWNYPITC